MRFIFVGGCGRSGTTLVQKLLVSHSRITGGPEFDHTKDIFSLYKRMTSDIFLDRQSFFYSKDDLTKSFQAFYKSLFLKSFNKKPNVVYISEKTPENINVANILLEVFPDSLFVNVVRDGRDVLLSHKKVQRRYGKKASHEPGWRTTRICDLWNSAIDKYYSLKKKPILFSRLITIKFEDLILNPEKELSRLCSFLSLDMEARLLHPEQITKDTTGAIIDGLWLTEQMYRQSFNSSKIDSWKSELDIYNKFIANILMGRNLAALGYKTLPIYLLLGKITRRIRLDR